MVRVESRRSVPRWRGLYPHEPSPGDKSCFANGRRGEARKHLAAQVGYVAVLAQPVTMDSGTKPLLEGVRRVSLISDSLFAAPLTRREVLNPMSLSSYAKPTPSSSRAALENVVITHELKARPARAIDTKAESQALRRLSREMAVSPNELPNTLLELALELCGADTAGLSLLEATPGGETIFRWTNVAGTLRTEVGGFTPRDFSPCGVCLDAGSPQLLEYPERLFQYLNSVNVPIVEALIIPLVPIGNDPLGTIWIVSHREGKHFDCEDVRIMTSLAEFASSALLLVRTLDAEREARQRVESEVKKREQTEEALRKTGAKLETLVAERTAALRLLSARLLRLQDDERRRIARELHDGIGQYLAGLKMNLDQLNRTDKSESQNQLLSECLKNVEECINDARTMSYLLHPPLLDEIGFEAAGRWYVDGFSQRSGIQTKLNMSSALGRLPKLIELTLFRILQESLNNVHRHSGSTAVDIQLDVDAESVTLAVTDFGHGMFPEVSGISSEPGKGVGLTGMAERLAELNGRLDIRSDATGTTVKATIPLSEDVYAD